MIGCHLIGNNPGLNDSPTVFRFEQDVINFYNWDRVAQQTEDVLMDVCKDKHF